MVSQILLRTHPFTSREIGGSQESPGHNLHDDFQILPIRPVKQPQPQRMNMNTSRIVQVKYIAGTRRRCSRRFPAKARRNLRMANSSRLYCSTEQFHLIAVPRDGGWFLSSSDFMYLVDADRQSERRILFCPGIPGTGKAILASNCGRQTHSSLRE